LPYVDNGGTSRFFIDKEARSSVMQVTEMYHHQVDWSQFPFGLTDWANEVSLKADKDRTPEQREQFKQQVIKTIEADRLMMDGARGEPLHCGSLSELYDTLGWPAGHWTSL
jgi:hypothetical protein